jgi:Protein of unknown function (DUF3887)
VRIFGLNPEGNSTSFSLRRLSMNTRSHSFPFGSKATLVSHALVCTIVTVYFVSGPAKANAISQEAERDLKVQQVHRLINVPEFVGVRHFDRTADATEVVRKLAAEDYEGIRKDFNDTMKANLSAERMKEVWRAVIEHLGEFKSQGKPESQMKEGWEIVVIGCELERGRVNVEVDYDPSGKIGGLWTRPVQ